MIIEKLSDLSIKIIILIAVGILIFTSLFIFLDFVKYKLQMPHEKYFEAECKIIGNYTFVSIVSKYDIKSMEFFFKNETLAKLNSISKDSEYPVLIDKVIVGPIGIKYSVNNETKFAYVLCKKEKEESLLRKIIGI